MLGIERKQIIINLLKQNNKVYVSELSKSLNVTGETIRRDLKEIEKRGIAFRSHGGAMLNAQWDVKPFIERELSNRELKERISECAKDLVDDGMVLMVDASTTTKLALEKINPKFRITVITNSYTLINEFADTGRFRFIATGGECYGRYKAYVGSDALNTIRRYNVDLALLSCHSLSMDRGFMESNELEADVKAAMSAQAEHTVVLADHTKFDRKSRVNSLTFKDVETIVTDKAPCDKWVGFSRDQGVNLIYPEAER